jgi:hypothetical protein
MNIKNTLESCEKHAKILQRMHKKTTNFLMKLHEELQCNDEKDKLKNKLIYLFLVGLIGLDAFQLSMMIKQ